MTSVVLAGVAGQPVVETARLLAGAALCAGLDVSFSEFPSPLACGGPVSAHVRMGREVHSPVVGDGEADLLLAFEEIEAVRAAALLARGGLAAVRQRVVPPWRMRAGLEPLPDVLAALEAVTSRVVRVPVETAAGPTDGEAYSGLVLLGLASTLAPPPLEAYVEALRSSGRADVDACRRALERGRGLAALARRGA